MSSELPDYYFRVRENGALVFRVQDDLRQRRLDMDPIASVNLRTDEIKPQGARKLLEADLDAIKAWISDRKETLDWRRIDDISRAIDHMNLTAHWAQTNATDQELDAVTDTLLMAMHDLRSVLVRKKAERLAGPKA